MAALNSTASPAAPKGDRLRVLVVDDDRKLCRLIRDYLEPMGYSVDAVHTGLDGVKAATEQAWDAIILDVMMPELDGFEALKRIRAKVATPVLMLTARGEEADRIVGLEIGADDYLPKTFSTRELLARLRAVIRRSNTTAEITEQESIEDGPADVEAGSVRINPETRAVSVNGTALELTPVEFELLLSLARGHGRVKSREALLDEIRDRNYEVFDRSIDVHVSALRRKLGDDPKEPRFIKTIRAVGYMLLKEST
jgi:DNA-binding response OmpR family regulator